MPGHAQSGEGGGGWGVITRFYSTTAYSPAKVDHTMQQLNQMLHVTETNIKMHIIIDMYMYMQYVYKCQNQNFIVIQ